jgi:predicted DNA-binding transcriptional regulator YafY
MLEEIGIPITADRGRHGAYSLVAGFKLPPMMFTDDEALALSVGLLAARSMGLMEAASAVASAQAKLERVMPENLKNRTRSVAETVMLDLSRSAGAGTSETLFALSSAAQSHRRVRMCYRSVQGDDTERDFDPYGLAHRAGNWYVVGMCHLRKGLRSFRLDRVREVRVGAEAFERPMDFDAVAHLTFSIATLPRSIVAEVLLHADMQRSLETLGGAIGLFEPVDDGVLLRSQVDDLDWFARQLARLPFPFTIHSPDALRDSLRQLALRLHDTAACVG